MSPETEKLLTIVGATLFIVQAAERVLAEALVLVLPDKLPTSMEDLSSTSAEVRSRTLGELVKRLRRKVDVSEDLDQMLSDFLADRNTFVHRLEEVGRPRMSSEEGVRATGKFVTELYANARFITTVFADLIVRWADEMKITGTQIQALRDLISEEHVGISEGAIFQRGTNESN